MNDNYESLYARYRKAAGIHVPTVSFLLSAVRSVPVLLGI